MYCKEKLASMTVGMESIWKATVPPTVMMVISFLEMDVVQPVMLRPVTAVLLL
jgi:hypothetical protein